MAGPSLPPEPPLLMGLLQGNGAAGTGWTAICTIIVNAMRSQGFGYSSWGAISKSVIELIGAAFIDDTDLLSVPLWSFQFYHWSCSPDQNARRLDHWDNMLCSTGGALEKSKSYWYLLNYECNQDQYGATNLRHPPPVIFPFTTTISLRSKKSLGIMNQPDGKMKEEKHTSSTSPPLGLPA
jgi:hypothetical protein